MVWDNLRRHVWTERDAHSEALQKICPSAYRMILYISHHDISQALTQKVLNVNRDTILVCIDIYIY